LVLFFKKEHLSFFLLIGLSMPNPRVSPIDVAAPGVSYHELAGPSVSPPQPPCFLFGGMPAYLAAQVFAEYEVGGVGCYRVDGGLVTSDGVVLRGSQAFWSLALNHPEHLVQRIVAPGGMNRLALPVRRRPGQGAVITGPGYGVYGHWLTDFLPRLFVLAQAGYDIGSLSFVLPADMPSFASGVLRMIGIPEAQVVRHDHAAELLQFDELLVPTALRLRSRLSPLFPQARDFWVDRLAAQMGRVDGGGGGRRVFVSRGLRAGQRRVTNRAQIEAMAAEAGYEIVRPETLKLPEQIAMFAGAGRMVGEYGSGLHGAMFAPPGAVVCALRGTSRHPGFLQSGLAQVCGQQAGYVFGASPEAAIRQEIQIDPGTFAMGLRAMEVWGEPRFG
jgi:capsular polysaccharide biosynthesis protein